MDITSSALMMWLGIWSLLPTTPTYEIEHFYTYDKNQKQQPLLLQKKVFLPESPQSDAFVRNMKLPKVGIAAHASIARPGPTVQKLKSPHTPGRLITLQNNREAIRLMEKLAKGHNNYSPVVKWEGMDCIPTNSLIIQSKPFVTEKLIRQRLEQSAKVKVINLQRLEGNQWVVEVGDVIVPPNILVLANMISEDTAWVDWARVHFIPIHASISGVMSVTTPASLNLGYNKQLDIVITVYKSTIKVRQDLLPKLGHNLFVPQPKKDEVWYDFGAAKISEEKFPEKTVIRITTPFRYLNHGITNIPPAQVAYAEGKEESVLLIPGVAYDTWSVISGTDIDDIQAMPSIPPITVPTAPEAFTRVILPWQMVGLAGGGIGLSLFILACFIVGIKRANRLSLWYTERNAKNKLWWDLEDAARSYALPSYKEWRVVYARTSEKLSKVLAEFYDIHVPISSDSTNIPELGNLLCELEKVYKPDAKPDHKKLVHDVVAFAKTRRS